ncbi:MAG TPA: ATP-binding protein [Ferruginibacter sp.]|jgi:two-component system sensor histidine kinase/response regulator|nr:ATP-binding protein [Ferruginibacter sp.]
MNKLRILIVEDNDNDADLLKRELQKSALQFVSEIVETREKFEHALLSFIPDIILSDYSLPAFDAESAFDIKQKLLPHIPFIIVSGVIGEENAVELIKKGVTDYIQKGKLFTLSQKITRALKELKEKEEKEIITEKVKIQAEELLIANKELNENAVLLISQEKKLISINEDLLRLNRHLEKRVSERTLELENLNLELKEISLSKDKFIAVISHDLRNPLSALLLASNMLDEGIANQQFKPIEPFAKIINRTTKNLLTQLNELIEWSKIRQNKTMLKFERLHLVEDVNQSLQLLMDNATQKSIILQNKVPAELHVKADTLMLQSILQNLITNAIKFSNPGGSVIVDARIKDFMTEVCIIDRGIGMDEHISKNIFLKHNTHTAPGTENEKGSGVGLNLVYDFVTQNGGTLRVESEIEKGTSIFFTLPSA